VAAEKGGKRRRISEEGGLSGVKGDGGMAGGARCDKRW